jgi:NAD+ kinase
VVERRFFRGAAVSANPEIKESEAEARSIASFLRQHGLESEVFGDLQGEDLKGALTAGELDLLIALGGDGTMLRASHLCAPFGVPILGINFGSFGFLTEIEREQWAQAVPSLLEGRYWVERRMMLHGELWREEHLAQSWDVVNDAVVSRGQIVRPIRLKAYLDGHLWAEFLADGLIVATPTGSTAYALAAGGPVLSPELRNVLLVPVAPHRSMNRAMVLPETISVVVQAQSDHQAVVSMDGQEPLPLSENDELRLRASDLQASFVRLREPGYFYRAIHSMVGGGDC